MLKFLQIEFDIQKKSVNSQKRFVNRNCLFFERMVNSNLKNQDWEG